MTERREFLRRASLLAAGSAAACAVPSSTLATAATPQTATLPSHGSWDMSWTARVTGRYKMAFDAHEISEGTCLHQVRSFLAGYKSVYNIDDKDLSAVLVIRHAAIPMALGDEAWSDGKFGTDAKLKDDAGAPATINPFLTNSTFNFTWPDGTLDKLLARGVVVLACDLALRNVTGQIARARSITYQDAAAFVERTLIPGIIKMPSGIFATSHAQQLGCGVLNAV